MINVYLIGHGFMDAADNAPPLPVGFHTYVRDDKMLDGRKIASVIDNGPLGYVVTSGDEEWKANYPGCLLKEHYLCSDLASYKDVNTTQKWLKKPNNGRQEMPNGILFNLPGGDYLFFTKQSRAVRLSTIFNDLRVKFTGCPWQIHWMACRSIITGIGNPEKLAAINGGDLVSAESLT